VADNPPGDAIRQAMAGAAGYLALVTRTNPLGSADALLDRPDTDAALISALDEARGTAEEAVRRAWYASGAPASDDPVLERLLDDISRIFDSLAHLRGLIRHAHASVPRAVFVPGVTPPGGHPSAEAAQERAGAVRDAILRWARQAALRARMAASVARGHGSTAAALAGALGHEVPGETLRKRWRAHVESPSCCLWCRRLDGVTIGLRESFAPYLGGPVAVGGGGRHVATPAGARRYGLPVGAEIIYTHPPRLYHGQLQGPLLHPFCHCELEIVRVGEAAEVPSHDDQEPGAKGEFLSAEDVQAMTGDEYQADLAFLRAAAHELDQVLRRLAGGRGQ
jgi:hypothetical protein